MKKLLLVDGHAIMHRAYHAMPGLTDRQGRPTGAVYGFVRMLLRAIKDLQPSHVAVAFDRPEPTFRKAIYIAYQAQRPEPDADLIDQFTRVRELLTAMEIPIYEKPGFEADDVIGTIAHVISTLRGDSREEEKSPTDKQKDFSSSPRSSSEGRNDKNFQTIILTGDKDMMQLVNDRVSLYLPIKGVSEAQLVGPAEVREKLGIPPELVIDYKALVGDPSDNYPGVTGIGPKTAATLLHKFKTFDGIYSVISTLSDSEEEKSPSGTSFTSDSQGDFSRAVSQGVRNDNLTQNTIKKLTAGRQAGEISKELAQIKTDVPLDFNLDKCEAVIKNPGRLARVLEDYGFKTLARQMELDKAVGGGVEQLKLA